MKSSCQRIDALITPFVDGELPEPDSRNVEDHLRRCPPCYSRVSAERTVRTLVRDNHSMLAAPRAPDGLRTRCAALSHGADGARGVGRAPANWRTRLTPYALAASLVVVVGGAFVYQATDNSARVLAAELTADHLKCFALNRALGTHEEASVVESSLASSFGWRAHLPENPASAGLELIGERPCLYGQGKIAHIMYRHNGDPVSLFMLPNTARKQDLVDVLGHEAAIWCVGNRTFVLLTRKSRPEVEQLAAYVRASLHE